jgi:hypothetical protein
MKRAEWSYLFIFYIYNLKKDLYAAELCTQHIPKICPICVIADNTASLKIGRDLYKACTSSELLVETPGNIWVWSNLFQKMEDKIGYHNGFRLGCRSSGCRDIIEFSVQIPIQQCIEKKEKS